MKHLFYITVVILLFSCAEKTAENSKYSSSIAQLTEIYTTLDSSYAVFSQIDNDSLKNIMNESQKKSEMIKQVYQSDTLNPEFEKIMLKARGGIFKTIRKYLADSDNAKKEFDYSSGQYTTLKKNLIHEKLDETEANSFVSVEKNALMSLNKKINEMTSTVLYTLSGYEQLFFKMDSIYEFHEKN